MHTAYVGVHDSKSKDNSIHLQVDDVGKPIFLILTSYKAIKWVIEGPGAKDISAVLVSSMRSRSQLKGEMKNNLPIYYFPLRKFTYALESKCECQGSNYYCPSKDLFDTIDQIELLTGQTMSSFTGSYGGEDFTVPQTLLNRKQVSALKHMAKENRIAQEKCEGPDFSPQLLKNDQLQQLKDHSAVQYALAALESVQENRYEDFTQLLQPGQKNRYPDDIREMFLYKHNNYAGYEPAIAWHLIDSNMYQAIAANKKQVTIPVVLKRNQHKDVYIKVYLRQAGDRWFVSSIQ